MQDTKQCPLCGDRKLLDGFRRGDKNALTTVYRFFAPVVAGFLTKGFAFQSKGRTLQFRGYHQPSDLDNTLQETFVRAFAERSRLAFDGIHPYSSYIVTIARNLVLTEHRKKEVAMSDLFIEQKRDSEDALEHPASSAPILNAETQMMHREITKLYAIFVEELADEERAYFQARFEEKLTQVQAGEKAGLSHMQARTREMKLRKLFLKFMHDHGYFKAYDGKQADA